MVRFFLNMVRESHHIFTDKFMLSVVDLNRIEMATQEDRKWGIDHWAALFKATTWEELKMLAEQNSVLRDAVTTMYEMTADEAIREQCKAREKQERTLNTLIREKELAFQRLEQQIQQNQRLEQQIEELMQENKRLKNLSE